MATCAYCGGRTTKRDNGTVPGESLCATCERTVKTGELADAAPARDIRVGTKVRFSHPLSDGGMLHFTATVVKLVDDDMAWVEMPERVRRIPFPPLGGRRYGLYKRSQLVVKG